MGQMGGVRERGEGKRQIMSLYYNLKKKRKEFLKDLSIVFCVLVVNLALDFKLRSHCVHIEQHWNL